MYSVAVTEEEAQLSMLLLAIDGMADLTMFFRNHHQSAYVAIRVMNPYHIL